MAIEKTGVKNFTFENTNGSENLTDLQTLGVSRNGEKIGEALSKTKFMGLTGNYEIVNGQLQSAEFEIVNVNSNGGNRVGFWNHEKGLLSNKKTVIWPGNTAAVPKGWDFQTTGKRLRIGVPVKKGYIEFLKVKGTEVEGYCKDVFDAAIATLPYDVPFDYIPFALPNGSRAGSYDDLIMQVYEGVYDGAVGDITIIANRSKYVDFTLPFTDSGVSMIVPTQANSKNRAWLFLKPLTLDLWITSLCFFVFMGFVVWILEHRINQDFRGPPSHQIGTSLWFSFCTMVGVVIWFFVVFVLTQSYTASLSSLLTVQQLQPTITNINELLTKQSSVGYLEGSFVWGLLTSVGIKNLKSYRSPEELDKLLKLGGSNGGIDAAFDETPYIKLFLSKFPNKYIRADPTYETDGFGFAFSIGSPLVADISRAVLNVTESKRMNQLQMKWFGDQGNSWSSIPKVTSSGLNLGSFWGLFLITGIASIISLVIYFIIFLHKEQHTLRHTANESSNSSIKSKIQALLKIYDKRDLTSYTFRKSNPPKVVDNKIQANHGNPVGTSPNSNYLLSPSNDSIHDTNHEFSRSEDLNPSNQAVEMVVHTTMEIVPHS
ncbi:Glutamate receptor 2.7, partial [Cucurbita argyrosperma subsp. sororia]